MDPSIFFGRSRVTRQTLKPKQQSSQEDDVSSEVKVNNRKGVAKTVAKGNKENNLAKDGAAKGQKRQNAVKNRGQKEAKITVRGAAKDGEKTAAKSNVGSKKAVGSGKTASKSTVKSRTVHFEEKEDESVKQPASSGPVYLNVRRSDVVGDPSDEYEFFSIDENAAPPKKKPRKANASKKTPGWYGTVKWDPSRKPVLGKCINSKPSKAKQVTKQKSSKESAGIVCKSTKEVTSQNLKKTRLEDPNVQEKTDIKQKSDQPAETNPQTVGKCSREVAGQDLKKAALNNPKVLPTATSASSSPNFQPGNHVSSTPVSKPARVQSKLAVPSTSSCMPLASSSPANLLQKPHQSTANKQPDVRAKDLTADLQVEPTLSPCVEVGFEPSLVGMTETACSTSGSTPACAAVSVASTLRSYNRQSGRAQAKVPVRTPSVMPIPVISVRESPSFIEPEPLLEVPMTPSSSLPATVDEDSAEAVVSTPVTRSKSTVKFQALKATPAIELEAASSSPKSESSGRLSNCQENDGDLSGLFDDIPRDRISVVPSRMFENHRGTIFVPDTERSKRKLPTLSPCKAQCGSRTTRVNFVVPQSSPGLNDCFGFDDEDNHHSTQVTTRARQPPAVVVQAAKQQKAVKPRLSIQQVQALLRGELRLASPGNVTPRSVQTKLTDFVSSTPTSTPARLVKQTDAVLITPTPVPLFGEEEVDKDLPSPFIQPSRRSYDRFRPAKRIACGDEVHSDHEDEGEASNAVMQFNDATAPPKKKSRSYKKKKKPEEAQLDVWANEIASHFDEIEEIELQVE